LRIFNQFFTHVLYVPNPIYARLQILLIISNFDEVIPYKARLPSSLNMLKMSTVGRNERVQTFVLVVIGYFTHSQKFIRTL